MAKKRGNSSKRTKSSSRSSVAGNGGTKARRSGSHGRGASSKFSKTLRRAGTKLKTAGSTLASMAGEALSEVLADPKTVSRLTNAFTRSGSGGGGKKKTGLGREAQRPGDERFQEPGQDPVLAILNALATEGLCDIAQLAERTGLSLSALLLTLQPLRHFGLIECTESADDPAEPCILRITAAGGRLIVVGQAAHIREKAESFLDDGEPQESADTIDIPAEHDSRAAASSARPVGAGTAEEPFDDLE